MHIRSLRTLSLWLLLASFGLLIACDSKALPGGSKPQVVIQSPATGSQFRENDEVVVQSTATDPTGVARVELVVDGATVRTDTPPSGQSQPSFMLVQKWRALAGAHMLSVRAYNTSGAASDPATISIVVTPATAALPGVTATLPAAATLPATAVSAPTPIVPKAPTLTATPPPTATPAPKDRLLAALNSALSQIKTYRAHVPEEGREIEVVLPDRFRQDDPDAPIVRIGATYYQQVRGKWQTFQLSSVPYMDRVSLLWFRDQVTQSAEVASLGAGSVDGAPCVGYSSNLTVYRIPPPTPPNTPQAIKLSQPVKIWFKTQDGLPALIEYGPPTAVSVRFFDYNAPIEITPPQQ